MPSLSDIEMEELPSTSTHRAPIKKCERRLKTRFSFDAPDTEKTFFFDPLAEIVPPRRVIPSRKRERVEDDDVIIPAAKRFCPSRRTRRPPPSYLRPFAARRQFEETKAYIALEPMRMRFLNLDQIAPGDTLHVHVANLIDIFVTMMIQKAGGSLKDTKYWLQLDHEGYHENQGFFITHKTYQAVDGGVIVNQISTHMQSNKNISLDVGFTVAMSVFEARGNFVKGGFRGTAKKRLRGQGPRQTDSIRKGFVTSVLNSMMITTILNVRLHVDGVVQPTASRDMQKFIVMSAILTSEVKNVLMTTLNLYREKHFPSVISISSVKTVL
ncbi:hypothetical protein CAEBREN_23102 [Caenorhabditis brenneri]|uniref:Uncharacterized protein n=1 Tax=Caenorhabditis brenneri TaxID=135651 RepID=G0NZD8_CAEBE|nr:hypothetical protein CAEBREN_23102 [Caenorhabditis brenneri]